MRLQNQNRIQNQNQALINNSFNDARNRNEELKKILEESSEDELRVQYNLLRNKPNDPIKLKEYEALKVKLRIVNPQSKDYIINSDLYRKAADKINLMLIDSMPLDIKRAVYIVENAWYGGNLSYNNFCNRINELVNICRIQLKQINSSELNTEAVHYVIQRLFSDTIYFKNSNSIIKTHYPFRYDFNDFFGNTNFTNTFVSKLLRTHTGQCHSMPLLYLILAQELNTSAYLALAPNHSYIKFPIRNNMYSFECTSGFIVSDDWIMASGYINAASVNNKLYLNAQSKKETIAQCLLDLVMDYQIRFGYDYFVLSHSQNVFRLFNHNITARLIISNCSIVSCFHLAEKYNFPPLEKINDYSELKESYDFMVDYENKIYALGYRKIPNEEYEKWLNSAKENLQIQKQKKNSSFSSESAIKQ